MMLSLVAGPTDIVPFDSLEGTGLQFKPSRSVWLDYLGLVLVADAGDYPSHLYAIQLDGNAIRIGWRRNVTGLGSTYDRYAAVSHSVLVGFHKAHLPANAPLAIHEAGGWVNEGMMPDRLLSFGTAGAVQFSTLDDITPTTEYTLVAPVNSGAGSGLIQYAGGINGHHAWWLCDPGNGRLYLYDAVALAEVAGRRTGFGTAIASFGYSIKHDLFVVVRRDTTRSPEVDQLYVYVNEPVAASISVPAFASTPRKGARIRVTSTLLGSYSEPCANRHVRFESTVGTVEPEVVVTDEAGLAESTFYAPFSTATGAELSATLEQ